MISRYGLLCDECEKPLRHYVTIDARRMHFGRVQIRTIWGWFEGHRNCFNKRKRDYPRKAGPIRRWYQHAIRRAK